MCWGGGAGYPPLWVCPPLRVCLWVNATGPQRWWEGARCRCEVVVGEDETGSHVRTATQW